MERESLGSRLGFILISAGCAIGLGNVWRFPYIVGEYGGAAFILIYLLFLVIFGLPLMTMEFAVGRASRKSIADSFRALEPKGTKWHLFGWVGMAGNYLLMMFYTTISGWMFAYFIKMLKGDFVGMDPAQVGAEFGTLTASPGLVVGFMVFTVALGFIICSLGLKSGVEKITKVMMLALLAIIVVMAVRAVTLPGAGEGLKYYLIPDFSKMEGRVGEVVFAALGQAFFTLSIGVGS
ncbi:MAG: sodium-dependent transporter, partial [Clostridia bacterium]|nr:sodium-dependent transporter [Clostridia bacterium]